MASYLLPQALLAVPANQSVQFSPKQLGFRFHNSLRLSIFNSKPNLCSILANSSRNSFVVRSEGGSEDVLVDDGENEAVVEAVVAVEEEVSESRPPRQPRIKLGDIMGILNKRAVEASEELRPVPEIRTGDIVQIKLEVPENKRRLSVYKGIVISRQNAGIHTTIRIRRIIAGVGVEIVFPLYSPNIKEIKVVDRRKVRKARLYYLRDKLPRLSTFK